MAELESCPKCEKIVYEAEGYPAGNFLFCKGSSIIFIITTSVQIVKGGREIRYTIFIKW